MGDLLTQRPRGTTDILPQDVVRWQEIERTVRELCQVYGYQEIRTPVFEHTELFARGVGETTDIVEKEMYTFTDRGGRSVTLRPEGTAGVVRAFVENKLYGWADAVKLYYIGPMFRYEKPQKGRLRQLHQFGCEVFGASGPDVDAEVIALNVEVLRRSGLRDVQVELNSVGCSVCRPRHREQMVEKLTPFKEQLCTDCQRRLERNPLRIFDCKNEICQGVLMESGAPTILESLCDDCQIHFTGVQALLQSERITFKINPRLVRGLDYYTRTAWECVLPGYSSVAGGGRYNGLVAEAGGPETPGIGFAVGLDRLLMILADKQPEKSARSRLQIFVVVADPTAQVYGMEILQELRAAGIAADKDYLGKGMKAQLKSADRLGAAFTVIVGERELSKATVGLKNLVTGSQLELPRAELVEYLQSGGDKQ